MLILVALAILAGGLLLIRAGVKIIGALISLVGFVALAAVVALAVLGEAYRVPSESMAPTREVGDRIVAMDLGDPEVGDVVILNPPQGAMEEQTCGEQVPPGQLCPRATKQRASVTFVERVVGTGGDRIAVRDGHVIRNGKRASEPYAERCEGEACTFTGEVTVPDGAVFLMGDNRGALARQPLLGADPERLGQGPRGRPLLAAEAHRLRLVPRVFGYGSLVGDGAVPCELPGYRRHWGVAMDNRVDIPGYKHFVDEHGGRPAVYVCFLDLRPDPGSTVHGVAIEVDDLEALDARERNYDRVEVAPGLYTYVGSADGRARRDRGLEEGTARISRQYAERVEAGFAALGLPYAVDPDPCPRADLRVDASS